MVADVTVVGTGIIGLSSALALADRGVSVRLIGTTHHGDASSASAGMLTPTVEDELREVFDLAIAARDMYPAFLAGLEERTQIPVPLNRRGAIQIALTEAEAETLQHAHRERMRRTPGGRRHGGAVSGAASTGSVDGRTHPSANSSANPPVNQSANLSTTSSANPPANRSAPSIPHIGGELWLDPYELSSLEPALHHALGGLFVPNDGCVDTVLLLDALRVAVARHDGIEVVNEDVFDIDVSQDTCETTTNQAGRFVSRSVVLAVGAWTSTIKRSGTPAPVEPVRGQIVAYRGTPLRHVTYGPRGYLVPRSDGHTIAGSTFEHVGFDADTTPEGLAAVRTIGEEICPDLADAPIHTSWAGLRPVTPDMLPIIGPDPESPRVILACGHSRNGILLAPLTAQAVADFVTEEKLSYDLNRFRPARF